MEDDDEIDVLGEFNLESLLKKNEDQISSCYDGEHQLGLHCDSPWMLDSTTQPCWYDNRSDPQTSFGGFSPESYDTNTWSDKERYLLEKGFELFGKSWSRLAQYIGTKNSGQVKSYVKTMGVYGTTRIPVATPSFGIDSVDYNVTELIHDMEIPASIEEVIAVVSTAQPTVIQPSTQREVYTNASSTSHRKTKGRRKKNVVESNRSRVPTTKPKDMVQVYNAEEIKDVLTGNKEKDTIILPNGEQVIRIRHGSSVSDGSDVEIDIDSDVDSSKVELCDGKELLVKQKLPSKEEHTKEECSVKNEEITKVIEDGDTKELFSDTLYEVHNIYDGTVDVYVDNIGKEVSVVTDGFLDESEVTRIKVERETQVFKGDLITPSGKVMTVIVDDISNSYNFSPDCDIKPEQTGLSKYTTSIQGRLDMVYQLPPPTEETTIEPHLVTQEEELLHPEFFSKTHQGFSRYLKIRNYIIDSWKNGKPNYVTKTSVRAGLKSCGDVNLISRIHTYLERKGYINFGCEQCHYNTSDKTRDQPDSGYDRTVNSSSSRIVHSAEKRGETHRSRKKKLPYEDSSRTKKVPTRSVNSQEVKSMRLESDLTWKACKRKIKYPPHNGGYTLIHTESGEVLVQHSPEPNKISTRGVKPIKLIHCKSYSASNKAPYRIELEVSALVLVDVHSHLSPKCEVIGLLGGVYSTQSNVLSIITAVPCRTILSSNVHCDMCPVSQCESSELITSKGLSVVGWYHSHPNFDPSPSDTDVNTQSTLQSWFNETGKPFVGLIISPYFSVHNVSSYRCCQVKMENSGPVPYQMEMKVTSFSDSDMLSLRQSLEAALQTLQKSEPIKRLNIYKCLESIKYHLRKASPKVDEEKLSQVLHEIRDFFNRVSAKATLKDDR